MVSDKSFNISSNTNKIFVSDYPIKSKAYCRVFIDNIGEGTWTVVSDTLYDVINDSIVFTVAPTGTYLTIQVATTPAELTQTPTDNTIILTIKNEIKFLADNSTKILTLADNTANINGVYDNIAEIITVYNNINNVNTVATDISNVNTVATEINNINSVAGNSVNINSVAGNSVNINSVAGNSVNINSVAGNSVNINSVAGNMSTILTVQDNTDLVVTKAQEASNSANDADNSKVKASQWADNLEDVEVEVGKYSAKHWANKALLFSGYGDFMAQLYTKTEVDNKIKKRRNYLTNGNFQFWDYATSQTISGYGSDNRWNNSNVGSIKTHLRMTSGDTERALFESPYYSRTVINSVAGASNYVNKLQFIEDITKLAGKTVTLSFWAKADSSKNIAFKILQMFGTGGSPSSSAISNQQLVSLTTTWQKKTITIVLPSLVGKILGTDGVHTSYTRLDFEFDLGSTLSYSGIGQQSGTFDIAEVKLEDGSTATDGWSPYDGEWGSESIARMRYYERRYLSIHAYSPVGGTEYDCTFSLINKRVTPTSVLIASGSRNNVTNTGVVLYGTDGGRLFLINTNIGDTYAQGELYSFNAELG